MSRSAAEPSVSIVIPVFNGATFLAAAMACIRAQTHRPGQIVVVDDGSTDATAQVAAGLGADVEFIAQENRGPSAARNRGLERVQGDFVAFLDVDDLWPADNLAEHLKIFSTRPETDVVLGQTQLLVEAGGEINLRQTAHDGSSAPPHLFLIGAALFRRSVFARNGTFDVGKRYSEDLDWFIRARENQVRLQLRHRLALIKRCHTQNMTRGKPIDDMRLPAVLRASLARRRKAGGGVNPLEAPRR